MAAAVVVANPIAPPVRDLQISTTQLSTSPGSLIPFDKNLLKSISQPAPAANFAAALAQILGALAAESDRIGTEVNSGVSTPVAPAGTSQTPPVFLPVPDAAPSEATPNGLSTSTAINSAVVAASTPALQQVVSAISAETAYLGNQVVQAAYATVGALVNTPYLIFQAVNAVLAGDLSTAFATIVKAIKAFIHPGLILVGDLGNVYLMPPTTSTPNAGAAAADSTGIAASPATAAGESASASVTSTADPGSADPRQTKRAGSATHATASTGQARSSASTPGTANSSRSADSLGAEQPKPTSAAAGKPGSASSGRPQNSGGRDASSGD